MRAKALLENQKKGLYHKQRSKKWFSVRRKIISSTDVAAILEENNFQSPYQILVKKITNPETKITKHMNHGNLFEPVARNIYEIIKGTTVHELGLIIHDVYKFLGASPDGLSELGVLLEIKCPYTRIISGRILEKYWIQMQIQMEVCDLNVVDFMECSFKECSFKEYEKKTCDWKGTISDESFKVNPRSTTKYEKHWWCENYRIVRVSRDKQWFADNFQELVKFNEVLRKHIKSGPDKLDKACIPYKKWDDWVSATKIRNYVMDDPILDWLDLYQPRTYGKSNMFAHFIMQRGNEFEQNIIEIIQQDHWDDFVHIAMDHQARSSKKFDETCAAIKNGVPIIYKGVLHDEKTKLYGIPDLIVRSDYLSKIFNHVKKYKKPYHYVIIDIKLKKLHLRVNKKTLSTTPLVNTFRSQLYIYTRMLNKLQERKSSKAYILGNGWKYKQRGIMYSSANPFDRPGVINFNAEISKKTRDAVVWIRDVRKFGKEWSINPPSIPELYPNMCNSYDQQWRHIKNKIAADIKEITSLWNCGPKNRRLANENGVYGWDDDACIADALGHSGTKTAGTLQAILDVNQGNFTGQHVYEYQNNNTKRERARYMSDINEVSNGLMEPEKISSDMYDFRRCSKQDLFVDFETVPNIISGLGDIIFMIGVGWITDHKYTTTGRKSKKKQRLEKITHGDGKWNYTCFIVNDLNYKEESKMLKNFNEFAKKFHEPRMFHWGHFEKTQYSRSIMRHNIYVNHNWCDLLALFKAEPIVVRGALNFSIKSIGKAMYLNGMISTIWKGDVTDGLDAAVQIFQHFNKKMDSSRMQCVKKYNEVDVKIMWEMLVYIRKNH